MARTFMGWTGRGMPKMAPVKMLKRPEKMRVEDSEIELRSARAIMSGKNEPRSPTAPDISARGVWRRVVTLLRWMRRRRLKNAISRRSAWTLGSNDD